MQLSVYHGTCWKILCQNLWKADRCVSIISIDSSIAKQPVPKFSPGHFVWELSDKPGKLSDENLYSTTLSKPWKFVGKSPTPYPGSIMWS